MEPTTPEGCTDCLAIGARWVHLRECLSCGHVGCCDSSLNRHARAHFADTQHALVASFNPDQGWGWCYADDLTLMHDPPPPGVHTATRNAHG